MDDQLEQQIEAYVDDLAQINKQLQQEIIERKQAEQALRKSEARYRQQFEQTQAALIKAEALYHTASSLISFESLPDVLQAVVDGVAASLPANRVSLINLNLERREAIHLVKGGPGADQIASVTFDELWQGLSGWVMRDLKPALSPKNIPDPRESPAVQQRRADTNCGAIIVVPVRYRDKSLGTLTAINRPDEPDFTEQDVELMVAMANQAAVAIENTRLFQALRESEARLRTVVKSAPIVLWALDGEGLFTLVEGKGLEALGLGPNDIVGRSVFEDYHQLPPVIVKGSRRALAGQRLTSIVEVAGLTWETRYSPLRDQHGEVVGAVSVATDITERMRAEKALAEERNLLRTLIDNLPDFIFVKDTETRFVLNNKAHVQVLGANKQEEVLGKTDFDVFPEELAAQYYADDRAVVDSGQLLVDREEPYIDIEGNLRWLSTTKVALRDSQGEIVGLVGMSRDITDYKRTNELLRDAHDELEMRVLERTAELAKANKTLQDEIIERKRVEHALRESEQRYKQLLGSVTDYIYTVNVENGHVISTTHSPNCVAVTGYTSRDYEMDPHLWYRMVHEEDRSAVIEQASKLLVDEAVPLEHRIIHKDGSVRWVKNTPVPRKDDLGDVVSYDGLIADITERKQAEEERERLFEEVKAGRERLQALSHRLVEVQEAERRHIARELHDEVGQLLTGLKLSLEMSTDLSEDIVKTDLREAQTLVNDLITQVRELSLELRPALLDDLGLVPTLQWHFERFYAQTKIQVKFKHSGVDRRFTPEVETTAYRIVQEALTNVARHAGVREALVQLWADQHQLTLEIKDNGPGFDPAAEQSAATSSGLSGMQERAALLGGQLMIKTFLGVGTKLTAHLPLINSSEGDQKVISN